MAAQSRAVAVGASYLDPIELLAVALSVVAVWWTAVRNPLCWPVGLLSVLLYAWIFHGARLYSDALLQIIYAALECYGWWCWRKAQQGNAVNAMSAVSAHPPVQRPRNVDLLAALAAGAIGAALLGALMSRYTDAALPWLDAALTAFSLVAQYWMARLYRANWPLWILVDLVYIALYGARGLPLTAALYAGFVALAVLGWRQWGSADAPTAKRAAAGGGER